MIGLLLSPVFRWLAGLALIVALAASIYAKGRVDGRDNERAKAIAANRANDSKADAAERGVLACPAGKWNREAGRCEP